MSNHFIFCERSKIDKFKTKEHLTSSEEAVSRFRILPLLLGSFLKNLPTDGGNVRTEPAILKSVKKLVYKNANKPLLSNLQRIFC